MSKAGRPSAGALVIWRTLGTLALAGAAAGCTGGGQPMMSLAGGRTATIAFESIDGPPQPVFQKLVEDLAAESVARQVNVISRESTPDYRVRSYMAAHVEKGHIHIGWVWDVYDANKRRVLRIADEETGAGNRTEAWNAADDAVLRRIAHSGMDRLAMFLNTGGAPGAAPPGADSGAVVATADALAGAADALAETVAAPSRSGTTPARRQQQADERAALAAALALADARQ